LLPIDITIILESLNENENEEGEKKVGTLNTIDGTPPYNYIIKNTNLFFIKNNNEIFTNKIFNYEEENIYNILIKVTDNNNQKFEKQINILINDINENYTDITLILENNTISNNITLGTTIGTFFTDDPDINGNNTYSYSISNTSRFRIESNNLITNYSYFYNDFDNENEKNYNITITSTDNDSGYSIIKNFTIIFTKL